ncbi:MAG: L,D-transpeptidase family protein [Candidatus Veblenbacteria bacterium]|nr:L,D-transpeptidase family protein [Candidatus Veblenbacteria bacterium]
MLKVFFICALFISGLTLATGTWAATDTDNDGLTDEEETKTYATDPALADTDADGYPDKLEIEHGFSPRFFGKKLTEVDSDNDYLVDAWELALATGIKEPDSDGDLYLDGTEVRAAYNPLNASPDSKLEKLISVDLKAQKLAYSLGGKILEEFAISSGLPRTPTPVGEFDVIAKRDIVHYRGINFDYPNTKWNLRFAWGKGYSYYIHGAWWHNNFGKPQSHGCVNVAYEHMERLYTWAQVGTKVIISS